MTGFGEDPHALVRTAEELVVRGDHHTAAAAYDRAYGLAPHDRQTAAARRRLLDRLAVHEHGLHFRYVPAGTRIVGSDNGDPDERPVHPVLLHGFWLTDAPLSWADYCRILGWSAPPQGAPPDPPEPKRSRVGPVFFIHQENKVRL